VKRKSRGGGLRGADDWLYSSQRGANLLNNAGFTNLVFDAAATPPLNSITDSPPGAGPFFYRVGIRQ
jgi:hypothetical protein